MIQIEIIESKDVNSLVEDVNYFLEQLEEYRFIDIRYSSFFTGENVIKNVVYSALIIYKVK